MQTLSLKGPWKLRAEFMDIGPEHVHEVLGRMQTGGVQQILRTSQHRYPANTFPVRTGTLTANVPCDVITPLVESGVMEEPLIKSNTKKSGWLKDLSWWFAREFEVSEALLENDEVRLHIEMLDFKADILINETPVARHRNAFRAFQMDVKRFLHAGTNQIVIRLTCGVEDHYPHDSIAYYAGSGAINQRIYMRKPQFTYGWDWCREVPTCGIGRDIYLAGFTGAAVTAFRGDTVSITEGGKSAELELFFEVDKSDICIAEDVELAYDISIGGETVHAARLERYMIGGLNFVTETVTIDNPQLWWPNGYGEQPLYAVSAKTTCRDVVNEMPEKRIGIRTISICHDKRADFTREFYFIVNGVRVFCKGGNWVPTDSVYLRTPDESYETLVREAKNANFTMLRIWGGGTYEPDCFYEYCSRYGILLMHDFMYACAYYPDHLDWFANEARLEADYQTRRLAHYPCMAIWTGNNEIHESYTDWFTGDIAPEWRHGGIIYNYIQPEAVRAHSPRIPYAPSSPYFGQFTAEIAGGKIPNMSTNPQWGKQANNPTAGDVHAWTYFFRDEQTKMKFHVELEAFDRFVGRFCSEYGFHGPLMESSILRYLDGDAFSLDHKHVIHHGESEFGRKGQLLSIGNHLRDSKTLSDREYLLYAGIAQGIFYLEMSESMRMKEFGSGNLIWMYNDAWPETGWTIIDYYLTRKISFYFLKRAFAPQKFILRVADGKVKLKAINESAADCAFKAEFGYMDLAGHKKDARTLSFALPPHSFSETTLDAAEDLSRGFYYILPGHPGFEPATSMRGYYRRYDFIKPALTVVSAKPDENGLTVTVKADVFVPVAYFKCADDRTKLSDNYFSLLPGVEKTVRVEGCTDVPEFLAVPMQRKPDNEPPEVLKFSFPHDD